VIRRLVGWLPLVAALATAAEAYDAEPAFRQGAIVVSAESGYGEQSNFGNQQQASGLEFWNAGVRVSVLPLGPRLSGPLRGALEVGLEPFFQHYFDPEPAYFGGLAAVARYHFLWQALGRAVPYVEVTGAAGGTDLETREIRSAFTFMLHMGAGLSVMIADRTAMYAGYRLQHVSNGNTARPNSGFESHTAVVGVSMFFP
jgi:hypothetical protein